MGRSTAHGAKHVKTTRLTAESTYLVCCGVSLEVLTFEIEIGMPRIVINVSKAFETSQKLRSPFNKSYPCTQARRSKEGWWGDLQKTQGNIGIRCRQRAREIVVPEVPAKRATPFYRVSCGALCRSCNVCMLTKYEPCACRDTRTTLTHSCLFQEPCANLQCCERAYVGNPWAEQRAGY